MKTSLVVLGVCGAATLAVLLIGNNGIPGVNPFSTNVESDVAEQADEFLTPLPEAASGLNDVLNRLHATSVQAFESIPAPIFGRERGPLFSLLNEDSPPKHQPDLTTKPTLSNGWSGRTQSELKADEAWLWLQLMFGITDRGFVYRGQDLQSDIVWKSVSGGWNPDQRRFDWRGIADRSLPAEEREAVRQMVVGYPVISHVKEDRFKTRKYDVQLPSSSPITSSDRIWRVRQMELVSLLKHDPPVAYKDRGPIWMDPETSHIPKKRPTRSLNELEVASLEALTEGRDRVVAWNESEQRLQLLGAIRAKDQCLKCHEVKRGDLLGAFTYWIEEERKTPEDAAVSQDESP